jgi:hypothetical protein
MKITVNEGRKIFAIQEEFNTKYPYLRLELITKNGKAGSGLSRMVRQSATLEECRTVYSKKTITIVPSMTVADLDRNFREVFGLGVIVKRKSGKVWLEITVSDGWTLEEQNRQGESLSKVAV